jgi:BolA protein
MHVADAIRRKLTDALAPERLEIVDESYRHQGHAGAHPEGESHFRVEVVSAAFAGKSRLERQRLVHRVLAEELAGRVHALQLSVRAPGE